MNIWQRIIHPYLRTEAQRQLLYGRRQRSLHLFEMLRRWNDTPENRFNLALIYMNLRRYSDALDLLEPIIRELPDQLFAGITYGQCLLLARRWTDAEELYTQLQSVNADNNLVKMLLNLSRDAVERDKFSISLDLQYQAAILTENKEPAKALELLIQAAGLTSEDAALHNNIGALKLKLKFPREDVLAEFQRAMQLSPDNDRYKRNYRKVWQKDKK